MKVGGPAPVVVPSGHVVGSTTVGSMMAGFSVQVVLTKPGPVGPALTHGGENAVVSVGLVQTFFVQAGDVPAVVPRKQGALAVAAWVAGPLAHVVTMKPGPPPTKTPLPPVQLSVVSTGVVAAKGATFADGQVVSIHPLPNVGPLTAHDAGAFGIADTGILVQTTVIQLGATPAAVPGTQTGPRVAAKLEADDVSQVVDTQPGEVPGRIPR